MLGIFRRKKTSKSTDNQKQLQEATQPSATDNEVTKAVDFENVAVAKTAEKPVTQEAVTEAKPQSKPSLFQRFKQGLQKTRQNFGEGLANLVLGKKKIDDDLLEEIETQLLLADVGVEATNRISKALTQAVKRNELADGQALMQALKRQLHEQLAPLQKPLSESLAKTPNTPHVILMVGVNGAGKTTTIGKLASQFKAEGKKVMLAAGDTFRAAAVEQLQVWGERNDIPVIAQHTGADSASVIYDAVSAAKARGMDVLIADTAGRLHTQHGLMDELKKVKRVMQKLDDTAPHEVMLVLDASIGQNALTQATQFHEAIGVTGLTMTKMDGTAKGGILFAVAEHLSLPFRFIGIGEGISDLRAFDAKLFVDALFDEEQLLADPENVHEEVLEEA